MIYKGAARKLEDIDLPRIAELIGVGEDPIHALIEVETRGTGFDKQGRVIILFEPHIFYSLLKGAKRKQAVDAGLAYPKWGEHPYPKESYTRLDAAMEIDETAALMSCSWGMGQIMGKNFDQVGFSSVHEMVEAFADGEDKQLEAMIQFLVTNKIDDDLRRIEQKSKRGLVVTPADWVPVVKVYNGAGYAKNEYHIRAATAYNRWLKIKDTPYGTSVDIRRAAEAEEEHHEAQPEASDSQAIVTTPTVVVEQQKPADPPPPDKVPGINASKIGGGFSIATILTAVTSAVSGVRKEYIFAIVGIALVGVLIWLVTRFWYANQVEKRKTGEREAEAKRAHEITMAKIASAKDQNSMTVEVTT